MIGGPRFFERAEIRDALAYLRLVRSPDDDLAFERVVNQPKRGVGNTSLAKLQSYAREDGRSLFVLTPMVLQTDEIKGGAKRGLNQFIDQINLWRDKLANGMPHTELAETILEESGYTDMLQKDRSPQAQTRLDNLKELVRAMGETEDLGALQGHSLEFWDVLVRASDNVAYRLSFNTLRDTYELIRGALVVIMADEVSDVGGHRDVLEAVRAQDASAARTAAEALVQQGTARVFDLLEALASEQEPPNTNSSGLATDPSEGPSS